MRVCYLPIAPGVFRPLKHTTPDCASSGLGQQQPSISFKAIGLRAQRDALDSRLTWPIKAPRHGFYRNGHWAPPPWPVTSCQHNP